MGRWLYDPRMLRRLYLPAALAAALALPAAAHATTFTVDPAAAAGCDASNVCKTITDANGKVADGDTVNIKKGAYNEAGPIFVAKKNVTFHATPGEVTITQSDKKTDTPVIKTAEGTVLDGLIVVTQENGAQAILVGGPNTTIKAGSAARLLKSAADAPVIGVADAVAAKTTIDGVLVLQTPPTTATDVAPPAILGNATNSLVILNSVVVSGTTTGAGVSINGGAGTAQAPVASQIFRSTILATGTTAGGVVITEAAGNAVPQLVQLDSSIVSPGPNGVGLAATSEAQTPGSAGAGISVTGTHVTIAGGAKPVTVESQADPAGNPISGAGVAGEVAAVFKRSIVHGKEASTVTTQSNLVGTTSKASISITNSDATDVAATGLTVSGNVKNADDALFADVTKRNFHLLINSPAIDKAGGLDSGDSTTDVDGEPRLAGAQSDYGADEFTEVAPKAALKVTPTDNVKTGQALTFDASGSTDANPGDKIVKYTWDFGDGSPAVDTTTPTTTHAYGAGGGFVAKVTVTDTLGGVSAPAAGPQVNVTDGTVPGVAISSPKSGVKLKIFKTTKKKITKGKKKGKFKVTKTRNQFTFKGTSSSAAGIENISLSLRRVSLGKATSRATAKSCTYFDGKTKFATKNCKNPVFFFLKKNDDGSWAYKTKKGVVFKAGKYELTAKALGKNGVAGTAKITFTLT